MKFGRASARRKAPCAERWFQRWAEKKNPGGASREGFYRERIAGMNPDFFVMICGELNMERDNAEQFKI
jgi:hypothetical protein